MANPWLEEFLWRGRPDGTTAFHVVLGAMTTDPFTQEEHTVFRGPLTIAQAADAGYDLAVIIAGINAAALAENEMLKGQNATLQAEIAALTPTQPEDQ